MPEIISTPPLIAAIALMTLATQFTRAFPFILIYLSARWSRFRIPEKLLESARLIPGAVMMVLLFTALPWQDPVQLTIQLPSLAVVVILHLAFRNVLLSITGGTAVHILLFQITIETFA